MIPGDLFTPRDREQMRALGVPPEEAARQVALFRDPPPFTRLVRPCTAGDGIRVLDESEQERLLEVFARAAAGRVGRFVPASGAATRMFKPLLEYQAGGEETEEVRRFFAELPRFPFYDELPRAAPPREVVEFLLGPGGLGHAELPKGLIPFHRAPEGGARTPVEEHLIEAALTVGEGRPCRVHFTVAPEHETRFRDHVERVRPELERLHRVRFEVTFSHQSKATDTLAVDLEDRPFRLDDGSLLFRPSGHGALLGNLQGLAAAGWDLVQVKNIDNVVPDAGKPLVVRWKRLLTGLLAELRERADRPLRVCGVVRNAGEPGGGPFWVQGPDGEVSPQIVETSQIDLSDPSQRAVHAASTHFNPVDLHCALRDRAGRPHDLARYVDPATVFISRKSHEGHPLKALERPGLWNGAMAGWETVFVEVPLATFAPVKTVFDLLRPEHQAQGG